MGQWGEERFIEDLVSQPPIESVDGGILDRFPRCDVVPFHCGPIRPLQDRAAGELTAIAADDYPLPAACLDNPVQHGQAAGEKERYIGNEAQAFPGAAVDDREYPEPATIGELIRHEVQ